MSRFLYIFLFFVDHVPGPEVGFKHQQADEDLYDINELHAEIDLYDIPVREPGQAEGQQHRDGPGVQGVKEEGDHGLARAGRSCSGVCRQITDDV